MKKCFSLFFLMLSCSTATLAQSLMGDVNGDNKVDFKDVSEISNYIMGKPSAAFDETKADINGDGRINSADLVRVINMAMVTLYDSYSLVVWKSDGTKDYYNINDLPETTFGDDIHVVKTSGGETKAYDKEEVLRYSFSLKDNPNDPQPVQNQNAREAFYVYQNDGHFDGFFYDEVQKIAFSEVDTFGIAHDGIVSQEIVTADSTYRFMLTAIDSIGFVQPDIIFSPKLKNMDELGIRDYIISIGRNSYLENTSSVVIVRDDIPEDLLPKIGDVLVGWDFDFYGEGGFGGKVKVIRRNSEWGYNNIQLYCEKLTDLSDVFYQFITTERVTADNRGNAARRLAGYRSDENIAMSRTRIADDTSLKLIDFDGTFKREISPIAKTSIILETGLKMESVIKASYNITWSRLYVKLDYNNSVDISPAATLKYNLGEDEIPLDFIPKFLKSIPFPAAAPIFCTHPLPQFVFRYGGDASAKVTFPKMHFHNYLTVTMDTDASPMMSYSYDMDYPHKAGDQSPIDTGDLQLSLNGFVQAAVKLTSDINTSDWVQDIFGAGISLNMFIGPKIEGSLSLSTAGLVEGEAYGMLSGSSIKVHACSLDFDAKGQVSFLWNDPEQTTFFEFSKQFGTLETFLLPAFKNSKASFSQGFREIKATVYPYRPTFIPSTIGIGLYDYEDKLVSSDFFAKSYAQKDSIGLTKQFSTKGLHSGYYLVKPIVKCLGFEMPVMSSATEIYVPPFLFVGETDRLDIIDVEGNGKKSQEYFQTNTKADNISINIQYENDEGVIDEYGRGNWIQASISGVNLQTEDGWLNLDVKKNNTFFKRKAYVIVIADDGTGEYRDTLLIKQKPFYTVFKTGSGYVTFPATYRNKTWGTCTGADGRYLVPSDVATKQTYTFTISASNLPTDIVAPTSCSRDGDIVTLKCSGTYQKNENTTVSSGSMEWEIVVDVSKKTGHIVSCSYSMETSSQTGEWKQDYWTKWSSSPNYKYRTVTIKGNTSFNEKMSFKKDIPCTYINETENGGYMEFFLSDITGSWGAGMTTQSGYYYENSQEYNGDGSARNNYPAQTYTDSIYTELTSNVIQDDDIKGEVSIRLYY